MQYFHRSSVEADAILKQADAFFSEVLRTQGHDRRARQFEGRMGTLSLNVRAEGGHYTLVTIDTDQPGESEIDKLAKRFFSVISAKKKSKHRMLGTY